MCFCCENDQVLFPIEMACVGQLYGENTWNWLANSHRAMPDLPDEALH